MWYKKSVNKYFTLLFKEKKMYSYVSSFIPSSVIVIGAGGTGSRLLPMLGQLVRSSIRQFNPNGWVERLPIYIIDGDTVEEKNLLRQNFIAKDVGQPKASVLASRYSAAFGIPILPIVSFVDGKNKLIPIGESNSISFNNSLVILAVDSAEARRVILKRMTVSGALENGYAMPSCFVIDAGNEDSFGQVKFFTFAPAICSTTKERVDRLTQQFPVLMPDKYRTNFIPMDVRYYKNLGSSAQELSCADLPQTLAINAMMATLICCVAQNFLQFRPMDYDGIRFSMDGAMTTEYNTPSRWLERVIHTSEFKEHNWLAPSSSFEDFYRYDIECEHDEYPGSIFNTSLTKLRAALAKAGLIVDEKRNIVPKQDKTVAQIKADQLDKQKEELVRIKKMNFKRTTQTSKNCWVT